MTAGQQGQTLNRDRVEADVISKLDLVWNREAPSLESSSMTPIAVVVRDQWPSAIRGAEAAKRALLMDRTKGERMFEQLLIAYRDDGMIYLKQAEAYERSGEMAAAATDYARAVTLLPFPGRKAEARAGLRRTRSRAAPD